MKFQSVNKLLEQSFKEHWDSPALSNYKGSTLNYSDLAVYIAKLHLAFRSCGLRPEDKVAICSRNQANWGVAFLASCTYGAVPVPILHEFKAANIHNLVNHSEAKVLFVDEIIWAEINPEEMPGLKIIVEVNRFECLHAAQHEYAGAFERLDANFRKAYPSKFCKTDLDYYTDSADELAIINYTSGTSGYSKGVMIPWRAVWSNLEFAHKYALPGVGEKSDVVSILPLAHMYGFMFEFLFEMYVGAHVHFLTRVPSPKVLIQAFADIRPHLIISVPLVIEKIYKSNLKPVLDKNRILFHLPLVNKLLERKICGKLKETFGGRFEEIIIGGAAFNPEVEKFFKRIGFPYTVGYGMTECAPIITYDDWKTNKLYSCGKTAPNIKIRIESSDPANIPGELQVRGANVFLGYYKNEEATTQAMTSDGWLRTGDMAVMDNDGYVFIKGRSKCMLLGPSGQNIYPEEIEAVLNNVTYITDSLVIEDNGGLTALVYPDYAKGEHDGISRDALISMLEEMLPDINKELPNYAKIRKLEFRTEDFERTPKKSIKRYLYQKN